MTKYARVVGGNWSTNATWSSTSGGAADTVAPTAADDVVLDASSGNVTIDSTPVCRSLNCTGYTGTLTHNAGVTLNIGDGTAGTGNVALKLVAGMTYTLGNATSSAINFISTSATQQTVDFAGKTSGDINFNGTNGSWKMTGSHTTTGTLTFSKTTLDINGQTCSWGKFLGTSGVSKTLTLGTANITITGTNAIVWDMTSTTFSGASSTITCNGNGPITFQNGSTFTYGTVNFTGNGTVTLNGGTVTFTNFNRTGTAVKTDILQVNTNITVTGVFTLAGNSATNRLLVQSSAVGTAVTITNSGATMTWSNVDLMDIALGTAFNASAITGKSGDCGGNSNITFTTGATQTWSGTSGGNWSANAWTSRVPLPQDDVAIASAFSASQTVTADMPRLGKSINWTGVSGNPTWSFGSLANSIFGSITLASSMTISGANKTTLRGRGSFTLTSVNKSYTQDIDIRAPGGTYTLGDKLNSGSSNLILTNGGFDAATFDVTIKSFNGSNSNTRSLTMGTGLWTLAETGALTIWNMATTTGLTFSGGSAEIKYANSTSNTRTFAGGGLTYGTLTYNVAGSTGQLTITGANTFDTINFSDTTNARTIVFPASTTTTILTTFNINGTAGKLMTINSSSSGTAATLSKSSGTVSCDYLSIKDSTATGGASWYAGANSTNVSGNTGWTFSAPGGNITLTPPVLTTLSSVQTPTTILLQEPSVLAPISSLQSPQSVIANLPNVLTSLSSVIAPQIQIDALITPTTLTVISSVQAPTNASIVEAITLSSVSALQDPEKNVVKLPAEQVATSSLQNPQVITDVVVTPPVFMASASVVPIDKSMTLEPSVIAATSSLPIHTFATLKDVATLLSSANLLDPDKKVEKLVNVISSLSSLQLATPIIIQDRLIVVAVLQLILSLPSLTFKSVTEHPLTDSVIYDASMIEGVGLEHQLTDPTVVSSNVTDPAVVAHSLAEPLAESHQIAE